MFLDIHELEMHKVEFDESLMPGKIDFGRGICQTEPLIAQGWAELLALEIHLQGSVRTAVEVSCDRCLEPVRRAANVDFNLFYSPIQTLAEEEEVEIKADDLEMGFYHGNGLLLEDVLKEQVLLALPMKNICRPGCAGLCPECGRNRNLGDCGCRPPGTDPRWAPLQDLKP